MKRIAIWILRYRIRRIRKSKSYNYNTITKGAFDNCIKSYTIAIMFLEAE